MTDNGHRAPQATVAVALTDGTPRTRTLEVPHHGPGVETLYLHQQISRSVLLDGDRTVIADLLAHQVAREVRRLILEWEPGIEDPDGDGP